MIEKWDIKNAEGVMTLFMHGSLSDARLMQKKLAGYCREPAQTNIPPYNYRFALTTEDQEILEKIKIAAAEAAESSRVVLPFMPATLQSAAAQRDSNVLEGTLFTLKKDDEAAFSAPPSGGEERITTLNLDLDGLKLTENTQKNILEPVKPAVEEKENFGDLSNSNNLILEGVGQDLNLARTEVKEIKEVPAAPAQPPASALESMPFMPEIEKEKSEDIKPKIDALLTKVFSKQEEAGQAKQEKGQPLGLEGILAAKTALDVYASAAPSKEEDKKNILSKEEDEKIQELLSKTQKTAFNIFEQEIKRLEEVSDHVVDPFDLMLPKSNEPAAPSPKIIPGKKGFDKKPAKQAAPKQSEGGPRPEVAPPPAPSAAEPAAPANINLENFTAPHVTRRVLNPLPEVDESTGMPILKAGKTFPPSAPKEPEAYFGPSMDVVGGREFEEKTQKNLSHLTKKINGAQNAPVKEESKADNFINPFDKFENDLKHEQSFIAEIDNKNSDKK
ncbi:MAG: hypothetical protein LBI01_07095 [Elusimicrobium sp.]|jgi:hypothetical protein|nr:hypothetical protein [Elusimicrobium sp.]